MLSPHYLHRRLAKHHLSSPSRSLPHVETRNRCRSRVALIRQQVRLIRLIRRRRILKEGALEILRRAIGRNDLVAIRVGEAHVQPLIVVHVAAEHERDDESVVVFAVQQVGEPDVVVVVGVVAAAAARPCGKGLVRAGHEAWLGRGVGRGLAGAKVEGEIGWGS